MAAAVSCCPSLSVSISFSQSKSHEIKWKLLKTCSTQFDIFSSNISFTLKIFNTFLTFIHKLYILKMFKLYPIVNVPIGKLVVHLVRYWTSTSASCKAHHESRKEHDHQLHHHHQQRNLAKRHVAALLLFSFLLLLLYCSPTTCVLRLI